MDTLFGLSMTTIMYVLVALFAGSVVAVAAIYLGNRVMFKMGLRNIPRRGLQTSLIVLGLMLSTLLITASFATGDTLDYSITRTTYDLLQRTDLELSFRGEAGGAAVEQAVFASDQTYVSESLAPALRSTFAGDPDIDGFLPFLFEPIPILNPSTRLSEPMVYLAGVDAEALAPLGGLTLTSGGKADLGALGESQAYVSERLAGKIDARTGDTLTIFAQDQPWQVQVAGIVKDELATGVIMAGNPNFGGGLAMSLPTVQRITGHPGEVNWMSVALKGDVRSSLQRSDVAAQRLESYFKSDEGRQVLGLGGLNVKVEQIKQDSVDTAELVGNMFTTIFLILGLFSIAAGIMLIFTIFVMLAAERKTEMGITRAVGARRSNLVQTFLAEGMAYNLVAGVVGVALGVAAGLGLIGLGVKLVMGDTMSFVTPHVTLRSLVVSYCLGVVLTFVTVAISSLRVSRLNIVAAIRGQEEVARREAKRRTRWLWVALGVPALILPPLGLYWILRKGLGLPWVWILGPAGIVLGAAMMALGKAANQDFPFSLGISMVPICAAVIARYYGAPSRPVWTTVGLLLAAYWLLPFNVTTRLFGEMDSGMEMFVLSGIMIVTAFTIIIAFNARLLNTLAESTAGTLRYRVALILGGLAIVAVAVGLLLGSSAGGLGQLLYLLAALLVLGAGLAFAAVRYAWFAPALKMGVAYPLANRFRTGMTIAMFALIVFSITVMSVIEASMLEMFGGDEARGGWDVVAETNRNNPVPDLRAALIESGTTEGTRVAEQIRDTGRTTAMPFTTQEVRQAGTTEWKDYLVRAGDDAFYANNQAVLEGRAKGYASDRDVYQAVQTTPNLVLMDSMPVQTSEFGGGTVGYDWRVKGIEIKDDTFDPFDVELRDPVSGQIGRVTVIGVFSSKIPSAPNQIFGVYTNEQTYTQVFGQPDYRQVFLRLAPGTDTRAAAKDIKAALVTKGVQAFSIDELVDDMLSTSRGMMRILQIFMGLGLFVGIAALGVIAFRSVVERRQQIGMLRAIGYQRGTVALSFILESSFIASMGILSGVVGAAILARNLLTSDYFSTTGGLTFFIPWVEVVAFIVIAYGFALLMTWWPSRRAARVPIAEALRYE